MAVVLTTISRGPEVRVLQVLLNLKVQPSPNLEIDGIFTPGTQEAVMRFQKQNRLFPEGVVGWHTWTLLARGVTPADILARADNPMAITVLGALGLFRRAADPSPMALAAMAQARAAFMEGRALDRAGTEKKVAAFLASVGAVPGQSWSYPFVFWCYAQVAGEQNPLPAVVSCPEVWSWAQSAGRLVHQPQPGDLFLAMDAEGPKGAYHAGFVTSIFRNNFDSLEATGNTKEGSDPNEVVALTVPIASCDFIRL